MSIETWKAEFYPEPASAPQTFLEAVDHSILKWEGLQTKALAAHGLDHDKDGVFDLAVYRDVDDDFVPNHRTCALCVMVNSQRGGCNECPLAKVRAEYDDGAESYIYKPCDSSRSDEEADPWELRMAEPQVMLMWLHKAREFVVKQGAK